MTNTATTAFAKLGSVSSGTMRPEDLLPTLLDVLEDLGPERAREVKQEALNDLITVEQDKLDELRSYIVDDLFITLNEYAPPYAYFGAHEGDGADYGFWVDFDTLEVDAKRSNGVVKVNAGDDLDEAADEAGVDMDMIATDHGNVTLMQRNEDRSWDVVWSVV